MLKITNAKCIQEQDWSRFVSEFYGKPYCFQQQNGCMDRGISYLTVPDEPYDILPDDIPEVVNGEEMGVSFKSWLARDPSQKIKDEKYDFERRLWWERNFYPDINEVANDLHAKGALEAGEYVIIIDW